MGSPAVAALVVLGCGGPAGSDPFATAGPSVGEANGGSNDAVSGDADDAGPATQADADPTTGDASTADTAVDDGPGTSGGAEPLPPMVQQTFLIGYNEAWFGAAFGTDLTTDFDLAYVQDTFDGIVDGGGHLVRLFLFPLPQGITLGPTPPQTQSVSQEFLDNLDTVLHEARLRGLWVYVTLLDANTITKLDGALLPLHDYGVNILTNVAGEGDAFDEHVVGPTLDVLDAHQDNVFGLDLVNEIRAAIQDGVFADPVAGPREFIARHAAFIHDHSPWLPVTATAGWGGAQYDISGGLFSGLGLDFYDLHVYADDGTFAGATAMCERAASDGVPIYLGEFGQSSHQVDDTLQFDATASFLNNAAALCFSGAFAWRWDPAESWWSYLRPDGTPRPAVQIMQVFGAQP